MSFVFVLLIAALGSFGQSIGEKTKGLAAMPGNFSLYYDAKAGKLFLEVSRWNSDFLYVKCRTAGVSSNDIGLDRGQIGKRSSFTSSAAAQGVAG